MKQYARFSILFIALIISITKTNGQVSQSQADKEKIIAGLKKSGQLRQEGSRYIFIVRNAADTQLIKDKYGNLLKEKNGTLNIGFEISDQTMPTKETQTKKIEQKDLQVNDIIRNNREPVTTNSNINNASGNSSCFCNVKEFGYVGVSSDKTQSNLFLEHTWIVPAGITKLKIEGWSAGGDGWNEDSNVGGGGGGGAYVFSCIDVKPGDIIKIRVPGGGSNYPLVVQFSDNSMGQLSVQSGHNAKSSTGGIRYDGASGRLQVNSGAFSSNTISLKGANGQKSYWFTIRPAEGHPMSTGIRAMLYGGDGGTAAKSNGGAKGAIRGPYSSDTERSNAQDGLYPGGGGGGGVVNWGMNNGKGAPGLVIFYY